MHRDTIVRWSDDKARLYKRDNRRSVFQVPIFPIRSMHGRKLAASIPRFIAPLVPTWPILSFYVVSGLVSRFTEFQSNSKRNWDRHSLSSSSWPFFITFPGHLEFAAVNAIVRACSLFRHECSSGFIGVSISSCVCGVRQYVYLWYASFSLSVRDVTVRLRDTKSFSI